jgi:multidrug efflux pump subunit AcrA (membrane-fusion protein)
MPSCLNVSLIFHAATQRDMRRSQAQREIEKHLATIAGFGADIALKDAALTSNDTQIERAKLTIPLLEEKNETAKSLYDKKYGTRPPLLDSEQQLVEKRAELKTAETNVKQIQNFRTPPVNALLTVPATNAVRMLFVRARVL